MNRAEYTLRGDELPDIQVTPPGPRSRALAARLAAVESPAFEARRLARQELSGEDQSSIVYARAQGSVVMCADGNRYVDLVAGFGALALGHCHPGLNAALAAQGGILSLALGDVYSSAIKLEAEECIAQLFGTPSARVMLGSSGADAVTAALKTVQLATGRPGVIAFVGGYHGLSHGPLAALGLAPRFRTPFESALSAHVRFAPYPASDLELDHSLSTVRAHFERDHAGAVLVEPILGRGGCIVPPKAFLHELRALCNEFGAMLIADEVWTGCGRSGSLFVSRDAKPDVACFGKALGGGFPVGACVGTAEVMAAWGSHGGSAIHTATHFGSPLASAAIVTTLSQLNDGNLVAHVERRGAQLRHELVAKGFRVQGAGYMLGIVLDSAAQALTVCRQLLARGFLVLTGGTEGNVLTLTPAFNIHDAQLARFVETLSALR